MAVLSTVRKLRGPIAGCHSCVSIVVSRGGISWAYAGPAAATTPASTPGKKAKTTQARHLSGAVIRERLGPAVRGDGMLQDILDRGHKSTNAINVAGRGVVPGVVS